VKKVDHLGRKDHTTTTELEYLLTEFEKRYRPNVRRAGPPSRYDTSRMYNAIRPILVAALPQVAKMPHYGDRMVSPITALIDLMDKQSPFFYGHEYGSSPYLPEETAKKRKKKAHKITGGSKPLGDPEDEPDGDDDDVCDIDFSAYWDMTGD